MRYYKRPYINQISRIVFSALCAGMYIPAAVNAQTQQEIDRAARESQRIQRDEQRRIQEDMEWFRKRMEERNKIDIITKEKEIQEDDERCWDIKEIVLNGVTLLSGEEQEEITENFTGRCLDSSDMERLLNEIRGYYLEKGYVGTEAHVVPGQDMSAGILGLLIVEGRLEDMILEDDSDGNHGEGQMPGKEANKNGQKSD